MKIKRLFVFALTGWTMGVYRDHYEWPPVTVVAVAVALVAVFWKEICNAE